MIISDMILGDFSGLIGKEIRGYENGRIAQGIIVAATATKDSNNILIKNSINNLLTVIDANQPIKFISSFEKWDGRTF